jgi:replicative DNA helicase
MSVPTADNAEHYVAIVRDGWVRRMVAEACASAVQGAERGDEGAELLSEILRRLAEITVEGPSETRSIRELLKERFAELGRIADAKARGETAATGIPTGLDALDALLGGLQTGIVTTAAGRPGMGKSSFALSCVRGASERGVGCHVFSLEDTRDAYCDRVISGESLVAAERLRQVSITRTEMGAIHGALDKFPRDRRWLVDDRSGITAEEIVRSVRRSLAENKTKLVVVDYVQLIRGRGTSREEIVSHAMNVLADAAKQDRVSYLVLSQLNRECEKRDDKRPMLADLKQAGTIEERSKCVLMLYRPSVYETAPDNVIEILVRKNNQGQIGGVSAKWDGATLRMY